VRVFFFVLFFALLLGQGHLALSEENHQHSDDCKTKPNEDDKNVCEAVANLDGSKCEKVKNYEKRVNCIQLIARSSQRMFLTNKPKKAPE
jgi:hypothetical protein